MMYAVAATQVVICLIKKPYCYSPLNTIGTEAVFQSISMKQICKESIWKASTRDNVVWSLVYIVLSAQYRDFQMF